MNAEHSAVKDAGEMTVIDITGGPLSPDEHAIHAEYQDDDPDADYFDDDDCQHEWELRSEHDSWVCAWCSAESTSPSMCEGDSDA